MKGVIASFLILSPVTFCTQAFAVDAVTCLRQTLGFSFDRATVEQSLHDVPGLKKMVIEILEDPNVPKQVKKILKHGLQDQKVEIVNLTDDLRAAWQVPDDTEAFAHSAAEGTYWSYPSAPESANQQLSKSGIQFKTDQAIAVSDRPITRQHNALESLEHELAHIRFTSFLKKNFNAICEKLPDSLAFKTRKGQWAMNRQLYDLLQEKYAYEMEIQVHLATREKILKGETSQWANLEGLNPSERTRVLGRSLVYQYELTDPQVVALADEKLSSILTGGKGVQEMNEAFRSYTSRDAKPMYEELPVALDFKRTIWKAQGREVTQVPNFHQINENLATLLHSRMGAARTTSLISHLLIDADSNATAREAMVKLFSENEVRRNLNQVGGWRLPTKSAPSWKEIVLAHPMIQKIQNPKFYTQNAQDEVVYDILKNGFENYIPDLHDPHLGESFEEAFDLADRATDALVEIRNQGISLSRPLANGSRISFMGDRNRHLWRLKQDWSLVLEFWKNLGLEDAFHAQFKTPDQFWNSPESLIEIYQRLKR